MELKYLRAAKIVLLIILILTVLNTVRLGYQVVTSYSQQGSVDYKVEELKKKLTSVAPTVEDYKLSGQQITWAEVGENNIFARRAKSPADPEEFSKPEPDQSPPKPDKSKQKTDQKQKEKPVPFTVIAISVHGDQKRNMAILRNKLSQTTHIVETGEQINGYEVIKIKKGTVVLESEGKENSLSLQESEEQKNGSLSG